MDGEKKRKEGKVGFTSSGTISLNKNEKKDRDGKEEE